MGNPHCLGFHKRGWLEFICIFPTALSAITLGIFPFALVMMAIEQPEEWPIPVIWFTWMFLGWIPILINEGRIFKKYFKSQL